MDYATSLPSDFNQMVYTITDAYNGELRYNPKIKWTGTSENNTVEATKPKFEVAEIQQMTNPVLFIEKPNNNIQNSTWMKYVRHLSK